MGLRKYNWQEIQAVYDRGLTIRQIMTRFGMSADTISKARKRGEFKGRTRTRKIPYQRDCHRCGDTFNLTGHDQKYCSQSCAASFNQLGTRRSDATRLKLKESAIRLNAASNFTDAWGKPRRAPRKLLEQVCLDCGSWFSTIPSASRMYCSMECTNKHRHHPNSLARRALLTAGYHSILVLSV